jgi:hypothetical protein
MTKAHEEMSCKLRRHTIVIPVLLEVRVDYTYLLILKPYAYRIRFQVLHS